MILKDVKMGQYYLIYVMLMKLMFYISFLIILIVFLKKVAYIDNYLKIIDQIKEEMTSWINEEI